MTDMIDLSVNRKVDVLELLRPVAGGETPAGLPPDSENAPRVEGKNVLIWLAGARNRALALDEEKAGLPAESTAPIGENEQPARMWENIITVSQTYLMDYGKDIRIVFYCLEGWMRRDGPAGFADGLLLLRGMLATYWEWLHPAPREGAEVDRRQDCLASYFVATEEMATEYTPLFLAMNQYFPVAKTEEATVFLGDCLIEGVSRLDASLISDSVRAEVARTDSATGRQWLDAVHRAIRECHSYAGMTTGLRFSFGPAPMPSMRKIQRYLEDFSVFLGTLYGRSVDVETLDDEDAAESGASLPVPELLAEQLLTNKRTDNLRLLRALGRCFRNNEPHSPVGYALNHWADLAEMSLPELLDAIGFVDDNERGGLQIFTGVKAPSRG